MLGKWHKHLEKQRRLGIPLDEQGNGKWFSHLCSCGLRVGGSLRQWIHHMAEEEHGAAPLLNDGEQEGPVRHEIHRRDGAPA